MGAVAVPYDILRSQFPRFCRINGTFLWIWAYHSRGATVNGNLERVASPEHCTAMPGQRKRRRNMELPPPGVIRDFRSDLDEPPDEPSHRPLDFFPFQVEFSEHVQKIVGQDAHEQASLVSCKFMTARLVPTQSILSLFNPILKVTSTVVKLDYFAAESLEFLAMNPILGKSSPICHSILAITLRALFQVFA
jgi:hypothetical protein